MFRLRDLNKTLLISALVMFSIHVGMAAGTNLSTGGYPFVVSSVGLPDNESVSVTISPNSASVGSSGSVYIFAIARNGAVYSFTPNGGWEQTVGANPAQFNGPPRPGIFSTLKAYAAYSTLPATVIVNSLPLIPASDNIDKVVYAGYGSNPSVMYQNSTYESLVTEAPRTQKAGLTVCKQTEYALCASSICTALTGQTVTDNQGGTYPAASCTCPIIRGDNIADLSLGNQVGSCVSPNPSVIYSTYGFTEPYPQQNASGQWSEQTNPGSGGCSGTTSAGAPQYYAQCWNWSCEVIAPIDGYRMAQCTCPMQTASVWIEGNSNNPCSSIPVGAALTKSAYDPTNY